MVRFSRVGLAAVLMGYPAVIRSRALMGHDVGHTLTSHGHHEGLRALPRNPMECGFSYQLADEGSRASRTTIPALAASPPPFDKSSPSPTLDLCVPISRPVPREGAMRWLELSAVGSRAAC